MKTKSVLTLTATLMCSPLAMAQSQIQPAPAAPLPTAVGPVSGATPITNQNTNANPNTGALRTPTAPMAATSAANPIYTTGTSSTSGIRPVTPPTQNINETNTGTTGQSAAAQPQSPRRNSTMTPGAAPLTASSQGTNAYDASVTRQIRERLTRQDLSMNARNVKIITVNGDVVLRGTVDSETERTTIQNIATGIVGSGRVKNETTVK